MLLDGSGFGSYHKVMVSLAERFESMVDRSGEHHLWLGFVAADGAPQMRVGSKLTTARRVGIGDRADPASSACHCVCGRAAMRPCRGSLAWFRVALTDRRSCRTRRWCGRPGVRGRSAGPSRSLGGDGSNSAGARYGRVDGGRCEAEHAVRVLRAAVALTTVNVGRVVYGTSRRFGAAGPVGGADAPILSTLERLARTTLGPFRSRG